MEVENLVELFLEVHRCKLGRVRAGYSKLNQFNLELKLVLKLWPLGRGFRSMFLFYLFSFLFNRETIRRRQTLGVCHAQNWIFLQTNRIYILRIYGKYETEQDSGNNVGRKTKSRHPTILLSLSYILCFLDFLPIM